MMDWIIRMEGAAIQNLGIAGLIIATITLIAAALALREVRRLSEAVPEAELAAARAAKLAAREDDLLFRAAAKDARYFAREMPRHMAIQNQLTHNYNETRRDGRGRRRKRALVQFDAILITRTEIWYKINGSKLPYGTSFSQIRRPEERVAENLQYAIHRPVQFYEDEEYNFFIRVGLEGAKMGIPALVRWKDVVDKLPGSNTYTVAVGVNSHNKIITKDLRKLPHAVVAGATDQGKSVQMVQWIITLITRNNPDMCQLILVDLKDGNEFGNFANVPHVIRYVEEKEDVLPALEWLENERSRRSKMFKGVCRNVYGWNSQRPDKLPYIFLFVDEIGDLMLNRELARDAEDKLSELSRKARSAGIHMILATQILEAKVLSIQIRGNFPGRACFSVPGYPESNLVIGNGSAANLGHRGRFIWQSGDSQMMLQAPLAEEREIDEAIAVATGKKATDKGRTFTEIDLFKCALENHGGYARAHELWHDCRDYMSKNKIANVLKMREYNFADPDASVIEIDGVRHILTWARRTAAGTQPRRLVAIDRFPHDTKELHEWAARNSQPETSEADGDDLNEEADDQSQRSHAENRKPETDEFEIYQPSWEKEFVE